MHLLLMGSRGQLGQALLNLYRATPGAGVTIWNRPEYDLAHPVIAEQVAGLAPDVVVNCAAWTDVDGAESNPAAAYAVNALGPHYLAEGCGRCGALLVQVSTNEVFAGEPGQVYREYDEPQPGSVYARTKLAGERAVTLRLDRFIIARTAWLFGVGGANFPSKITAAADKHGALRVVHDEWGNPTYASDAAVAIARLIEHNRSGIYHVVNEGQASRFELAQAVLQANGRGHIPLTPIAHTEWPRAAQPPLHAVLANQAAAALGIRLRPWREAVQEYALRITHHTSN